MISVSHLKAQLFVGHGSCDNSNLINSLVS